MTSYFTNKFSTGVLYSVVRVENSGRIFGDRPAGKGYPEGADIGISFSNRSGQCPANSLPVEQVVTVVRYSYLFAVLIYVMSDDQTSFSLLKVNALSSLFSGTVSFLASVMYDFYLLDQGKIVQCSFRWLPVILIVISVLAHAKYLPHPLDGITVFVLSYKFKFHLRLTEDEAAGVLQYLPFQLYF